MEHITTAQTDTVSVHDVIVWPSALAHEATLVGQNIQSSQRVFDDLHDQDVVVHKAVREQTAVKSTDLAAEFATDSVSDADKAKKLHMQGLELSKQAADRIVSAMVIKGQLDKEINFLGQKLETIEKLKQVAEQVQEAEGELNKAAEEDHDVQLRAIKKLHDQLDSLNQAEDDAKDYSEQATHAMDVLQAQAETGRSIDDDTMKKLGTTMTSLAEARSEISQEAVQVTDAVQSERKSTATMMTTASNAENLEKDLEKYKQQRYSQDANASVSGIPDTEAKRKEWMESLEHNDHFVLWISLAAASVLLFVVGACCLRRMRRRGYTALEREDIDKHLRVQSRDVRVGVDTESLFRKIAELEAELAEKESRLACTNCQNLQNQLNALDRQYRIEVTELRQSLEQSQRRPQQCEQCESLKDKVNALQIQHSSQLADLKEQLKNCEGTARTTSKSGCFPKRN